MTEPKDANLMSVNDLIDLCREGVFRLCGNTTDMSERAEASIRALALKAARKRIAELEREAAGP